MPKYTVIITRDITESVYVEVEVDNAEAAEDAAFEKLRDLDYVEWEVDDGSWDHSSPYVTDVTENDA